MLNRGTMIFILFLMIVTQSLAARPERFLPDDPIWNDPDQLPIAKPVELERSQVFDFLQNTFSDPGAGENRKARNINTLGEVPDSSWFTNRIGRYPMTIEQLEKGPDQSSGPDVSGPLTIIKLKTQGVTPGCVMKDRKGDTYYVKFDPVDYPELTTSAEVISTKFFHAFGYNVPENYVVSFRRDQLKLDASLHFTEADLDTLMRKAARDADGRIRALASKKIPGETIGWFTYYGRRSDDPNDLFDHEDRRELRGMRVLASWVNHYDIKTVNTLDVYLPDRKYVKHYLIDFGSTLGSRGVAPQYPRSGHEYLVDWHPILKSAATFGIWTQPWRKSRPSEYPEVGRFDSQYFDPPNWKPIYPNPAFSRMRNDDAFWAARIISRFTDEDVAAIVKTARISDPDAERYLTQTLLERRDKIVRYYFSRVNPLSDFQLTRKGDSWFLTFRNLGEEAGVGKAQSYRARWSRFDNRSLSLTAAESERTAHGRSIPVPSGSGAYWTAEIRTVSPDQPNWMKKVTITIRKGPTPAIVGIERES